MNRLFFSFIFFAAMACITQIIRSMDVPQESDTPGVTSVLQTMVPPQIVFLEPYLQSTLSLKFKQSNMAQLEYEIDDLSNKFSSLKAPTIFDVTFITLIFTPNQGTTEASCIVKNVSIYVSNQYIPPRVSCILLNNMMLNDCSFYAQEFNNPDVVRYLIEIGLSAYFRRYVLTCRQCTICLSEITDHESATLLKCGNAVHEKCYKPNIECLACREKIEKDFWHILKELPKINPNVGTAATDTPKRSMVNADPNHFSSKRAKQAS